MEVYTNQHVYVCVCVCVCVPYTKKMCIYNVQELMSGVKERQTTISISCQITRSTKTPNMVKTMCCRFLGRYYKVGGRF